MRRTLRSLGALLLLLAAVYLPAALASEASGRSYYDGLGRVVRASATPANAASGPTYQYDAHGNLNAASAGPVSAASPGFQ
jgi:hypothetical protein